MEAWRHTFLAEEKDLVALPDELSYTDGAQVACGFGTVYEGLEKIGISGDDAVLVVGLGPVGLGSSPCLRSQWVLTNSLEWMLLKNTWRLHRKLRVGRSRAKGWGR